MAQLRNFQLFRNENAFTHASHEAAIADFKQSNAWASMQDGEILLYSYTITGEENSPVHSLIGVVRNGKLDIITNEGTLREVVKNSIDALDNTITSTNGNYVNVTIEQENGLLKSVTVDETKLAGILNGLNYTHTNQNTDNITFKVFGTEQTDGKVSEKVDGTIVFDRALTATNKAATTGYVTDAINALDSTATIATIDNDNVVTLKAGIVETDGKVSNNTNADIVLAKVAKTGAAEDVSVDQIEGMTATNVQDALEELQGYINTINGQTITALPDQAVQVNTAENGNTTIGLKLNEEEGKAILSQTTDGLKTTLTVDTKKYPTESTAEGYVAEKAGKTYIQIKGVGGNVVSETDAAAFVKDGFLQSVTKDEQANTITFTWNTDAGIQATTISIKEFCDVYTAKENDWILLDGYEFSHKTQENIVIPEGQTTVTTVTAGNNVATAAGIATITVPELTIDKAGHITKQENKSYTIDLPVTAVAKVDGQTVVTPTVTDNDTTYTVGLAEVKPVKTESTDDYALLNNTTENPNAGATHTRVESITVDEFGRVTGYTLTTVQENFDMGMYN